MQERIEMMEDVFVGGQPSETDLESLAKDDFRAVVNLREFDEKDAALSPGEEGICVQKLGMEYLSFPVTKETLTPHLVDDFRAKLDLLLKPVFLHCKSGKRSAAFVMMDRAVQEGWSGAQTIEKAREIGFECDDAELRRFVESYVDGKQREAHA